ncbi:uncharacterized protein LOC115439792 [Manduca sexta]|uniref:uncharacterized protein LOC115439792 n=1 Tax=Manduca sexta TaxID=7130 RepID=UPI00188F15A1|nr:uncharacterized protein LOC115439792 [Manduca sexta]
MASVLILLFCFSLTKATLSLHSNWMPPAPYHLPPSQLDPTTPNIWTNQPTCKSANAQVYFLPTAPKPAKVTVLTEPAKVIPGAQEIKEINKDKTSLGVPPPPPPSPVLPGVLDKIPTIIPPVETSCPCLNRKSKILEQIFERTSSVLPNAFNYDQDLLNGFLSSLGL